MKTNRSAAKRFKVTAKGKLMYRKSHLNHLMHKKGRGGRIRRMMQDGQVAACDRRRLAKLLPGV